MPFWSFTVAASACVAPATIEALEGETVTVVGTGDTAVTVTLAMPVLPDAVAAIVAVPAATALTMPLELTVATAVLLEAHVTVCPFMTLPFWSFTVAASA